MSFLTVEEYKNMLGVSNLTDVQTAQVNMLLAQTGTRIENLLGGISKGPRTIKVHQSEIYYQGGAIKIYTPYLNIGEITKVNGEIYTGDWKTDGVHNNVIYLSSRYHGRDYPYMEIEVDNGYEPIPDDIKLLQYLMIRDTLNQMTGGDIVSKKIGDKTLQFSSNTADNMKSMIKSIINSYLTIHV